MEEDTKRRSPVVAGVIAVAILLLVIAGVTLLSKDKDADDQATTTSSQTSQTQQSSTLGDTTSTSQTEQNTASAAVKSGTYSATGSYNSPGGNEKITVSITIDNLGKVTDTSASAEAASPTSKQFQEQFIDNYKQSVVGKDIKTLNLSKLSGSSLTPKGFNDAVQQIVKQAEA